MNVFTSTFARNEKVTKYWSPSWETATVEFRADGTIDHSSNPIDAVYDIYTNGTHGLSRPASEMWDILRSMSDGPPHQIQDAFCR